MQVSKCETVIFLGGVYEWYTAMATNIKLYLLQGCNLRFKNFISTINDDGLNLCC